MNNSGSAVAPASKLTNTNELTTGRGLLEKFFTLFLKASDQSIDNWENYRPRLYVLSLTVLCAAIIVFNALYVVLGFKLATLHQLTILGALSALAVLYFFYRADGDFRIAVNLFLMISLMIVLVFVAISGGYHSPVIQTFILLPFLAFTLTPSRSALFWTILSVLGYLAFAFAEYFSFPVRNIIADRYLGITQFVSWLFTCLALVFCLYVYGRANRQFARNVASSIQQLSERAELDESTGLLRATAWDKSASSWIENAQDQRFGILIIKMHNLSEALAAFSSDHQAKIRQKLGKETLRFSNGRYVGCFFGIDEIRIFMPALQTSSALYNTGRSLIAALRRETRKIGESNIQVRAGCAISGVADSTLPSVSQKALAALGKSTNAQPCAMN